MTQQKQNNMQDFKITTTYKEYLKMKHLGIIKENENKRVFKEIRKGETAYKLVKNG